MTQAVAVTTDPASKVYEIGLRVLRYVLIGTVAVLGVRFFWKDAVPYMLEHSADQFRHYWQVRWWLLAHIGSGTVALLFGPFQFWSGLRRRHLNIHRLTGRVYLGAVALGAAAGYYLAAVSPGGADWSVALAALATAWVTTAGMALLAIKRRMIDVHKQWMIRSYVVTFAFVTFRWLNEMPALRSYLGDGAGVTIMWACWVLPLGVTEVVFQLQAMRAHSRKRAPATS